MHSREILRDAHAQSDNQDEEDDEFLESHESCQRHYGHAIRTKQVDGAHDDSVGEDEAEILSREEGLPAHAPVDQQDDYSLQEEDLVVMMVTEE